MITDRFFFGGIGSGILSDAQREEHDFYTTDPYAVEWLLKIESIDKNVWEPACGMGHISKVLEAAGHQVKSTDLVDRGYGTGGG